MDRFRALEVFSTVVRQGSFTRAADKLDTSPANVTRYINELEALLGARLLNRSSRRLSLTESGKALHDRALSILEDVAEPEAIASSSAVQPRGRLRVNGPLSFCIRHLAPRWPRFMSRYPEIVLDISLVDRVVDLVDEGYDLAVRISRGGSPALVSRKLATTRHVVCASPDYIARHGAPRRPEDLSRHACIAYTYSASFEECPSLIKRARRLSWPNAKSCMPKKAKPAERPPPHGPEIGCNP